MKRKKRILIAFGTRPEALKFVPLIKGLEKSSDFQCLVCLTGQHKQMLDQVVRLFKIPVHDNLKLMRANQTLSYVSGRVVSRFGKIISHTRPDLVFVQGDTATALMVGVASFYAKVPIAHLEAGLRTGNKFSPFPEEMNRTLLSHLADYHFTPTAQATRNLIEEGVPKKSIYQVGNTIVDTVRLARPLVKTAYPIFKGLDAKKKILFVTAHRRESFGRGLREIFMAFREIVSRFRDVQLVYPVHLNPEVSGPAHRILGRQKNVHLHRPLDYEETYWILKRCFLVLTDSGGIQEEAPSFHKPVLVLRDVTERQEGIRSGVAKLVGTNRARIIHETEALLRSPKRYRAMSSGKNPYGDGRSAERIISHMRTFLG